MTAIFSLIWMKSCDLWILWQLLHCALQYHIEPRECFLFFAFAPTAGIRSASPGGASKPHSGVGGEWNAKRYKWRRVFSDANQFCLFADILLEMSEKKSNNATYLSLLSGETLSGRFPRLSVVPPCGYFVYQPVSEISLKTLLKGCGLGPRSNSLDFGTDSHTGEAAWWKFTLPKQRLSWFGTVRLCILNVCRQKSREKKQLLLSTRFNTIIYA